MSTNKMEGVMSALNAMGTVAPAAADAAEEQQKPHGEGEEEEHGDTPATRRQMTRAEVKSLLMEEYLGELLQSLLMTSMNDASDEEVKGGDAPAKKKSAGEAIATTMPIFQQKNELAVAYLEMKEPEIVELGRIIFENPLVAASINHLNFSGNQFTTEKFNLFLHLVVTPILFFSGALAAAGKYDTKTYVNTADSEEDADAQKKPLAILLQRINHSLAFSARLATRNATPTAAMIAEQLPKIAYASDAAVANASSGNGAGFGVTGLEFDNNGSSTDGWKTFVAILSGDEETVIEEGEAIRQKYLGNSLFPKATGGVKGTDPAEDKDEEDKNSKFYTLSAAYNRMFGGADADDDNNNAAAIMDFVSVHLSTLSHLENAENYIHDVGARYSAMLMDMCPNLKYASFITNQMSTRAAKDIAQTFETRLEHIGAIMNVEKSNLIDKTFAVSSAATTVFAPATSLAEAEAMIRKTVLENTDEETFVTDDKEHEKAHAAAALSSILKASKLCTTVGKDKEVETLFLPFSVPPADYLANPFRVTPRLVEASSPFCLQQLYLDYNSLTDAGTETALSTIGSQAPALIKLGLSDNRVGNAGGASVAKHIIANPCSRVQHLNLSVNVMGDDAFVALAKALSCAYVVKNDDATTSGGDAYTLYFKKGVRFDRPPAHVYDVDTDLYIDDLVPAVAPIGIPVTIIPSEEDGEDGLGEGAAYANELKFTNDIVTLTQQQVDLLLVASKEEGAQMSINTRLYHIDLANQGNSVGTVGRTAILALAFSYKYLMNLDVTALEISNAEFRLLARSIQLGGTAKVNNTVAPNNNTTNTAAPYWQYTCGLINAEWYNNPSIFPQTEELVGRSLEAAIERCQIREAFVNEYFKKASDGDDEEDGQSSASVINQIRKKHSDAVAAAMNTIYTITTAPAAVAQTAPAKKTSPSSSKLPLIIGAIAAVGIVGAIAAKVANSNKK